MAKSDYSSRIDRVKRYIEENCRRPLSLAEMAEISCFSPFHFHRIFKAEAGESPADYQKRIRLSRAASELYKPRMTIGQIADDYGFSSPAAFSRDFKKFYGTSPREFQKGLYRERAVRREKEIVRKSYPVSVISLPSRFYLSKRVTGYNALPAAFGEISLRAAQAGLRTFTLMERVYDNPDITPREQCRFDVGLLTEKEIPFGDDYQAEEFTSPCHAACLYSGSVMKITRAFDCLYRDWLPPSGYFPADESPFILFGKMSGFTSLFTPVRCRAEVCLPLKIPK